MEPVALDILVVAPHPDDAELGMGGTIVKLQRDGFSVGVLDLTSGEPTPYGTPERRAEETAAATAVLQLDWRSNLGLPNRSLQPALEARARLANVFRQTRPRWLFAPYWVDAHPDHVAATQLVEDARFWAKLTKTDAPGEAYHGLAGEPFHPARIFYYYCVHLRITVQPQFLVDISDCWDRKEAALECYRSQFRDGRPPGEPTVIDHLRHQAATLGWCMGARYAEGFASREPIGLSTLRGLV